MGKKGVLKYHIEKLSSIATIEADLGKLHANLKEVFKAKGNMHRTVAAEIKKAERHIQVNYEYNPQEKVAAAEKLSVDLVNPTTKRSEGTLIFLK